MNWPAHQLVTPPPPLCYPDCQKVLPSILAEASQHNAQPKSFGSAMKLAAVGLAAASLLHGVAPAQAGVILTKREVKKVCLCVMSSPSFAGSMPRDSRLTTPMPPASQWHNGLPIPQNDCMHLG